MDQWLVYWKKYWEETAHRLIITADWHSSYDQLYEEAHIGDAFWVVVAGPHPNQHEWRLLERFSLATKDSLNPASNEYKYLFTGDPRSHDLFEPMAPHDLTPILTTLDFASDRRIRLLGRRIGWALQSPRRLSTLDGRKLAIYAQGLPRSSRRAPDAA